jgi:excinuclease ABC subunit C
VPTSAVSPLYALHRDVVLPAPTRWPATYPNSSRNGIYLIYDDHGAHLYVGRSNKIGRRLGSYFKECADPNECVYRIDAWRVRPAFLATIAIACDAETAELEQHLIRTLDPSHNVQHRPSRG